MSQGRKELLNLLSSTSYSESLTLSHWITLLNFFERNKDELDIVDLRLLVVACEDCREVFNENHQDKIRKEETNPDIYTHLEMLESKEITEKTSELKRITHKEETLSQDYVAIAQ